MKRCMQLIGACALVLALVSIATAQSVPTPVVRMGDWVEIGNEVFMNIIATMDIRYNTSQNYDFESQVRDRTASRNRSASTLYGGEGDFLQVETRWGADFRYKKNLRVRFLWEAQTVMDGNLIDDRNNNNSPGADPNSLGIAASPENNGLHIERFWIDYAFQGTPLRMRVGADLWRTDQAGLLGDDDPRFALFVDLDQVQLYAAANIQSESARLGLTNDNDFYYYTFGASYTNKPHKLALDIAYFRERYRGSSEQGGAAGERHDTVLISPSYTGAFGPIRVLGQFSAIVGKATGNLATDCSAAVGFQQCDYNVFGWGIVAHVEASLAGGLIKPFVGVIYGSGDSDPTDDKLGGFNTLPQNEITLMTGNGHMGYLTVSPSVDPWGPAAPARAGFAGGNLFRHTTGNPFGDRIGNTLHPGITSAYSNAGTLLIPAGVHLFPAKGHQFTLFYLYVGLSNSSLLEAAAAAAGTPLVPTNTNQVYNELTLYHEIDAVYTWTLSSHFDIRVNGYVMIPAAGVKDIARTQTCPDGLPCEGNDPALGARVRFRARF